MLHIPNDVLKVGMKSLLLCLVLPYIVTTTILVVCNEVFSFLLFALRWKNIVHASPSFNHISLEACLLLIFPLLLVLRLYFLAHSEDFFPLLITAYRLVLYPTCIWSHLQCGAPSRYL
jgi:hypothetical protein